MIVRRGRERAVLGATCVLAIAAPLALAHHLDHEVQDRLVPAVAALTGERVRIGGVEADLTGAVRLRDVRIGDLLEADAIEAAVSLDSLLAGQLGADEIRVHRPRVRVHVDRDGHSDWRALIDRVAARLARPGARAASGGTRGTRLRRVVVSGGDLIADVGGARVAVRDVALHPQAGGVRVVTGAVAITGDVGPYRIDGGIGRIGADVRLPSLAIDRVVAVGGRGALHGPAASLAAASIELIRDRPGGAWVLRAEVDDRGAPRHLEIALDREPGATALTIRGDRVPLAALAPLMPPGAGVGVEGARASGTLHLVRGLRTTVRADLTLDGAWIDHPAIAAAPVPVDGALELDATAAGTRLDVATLRLRRGGIDVSIAGWARLAGGRPVALAADVALAPARCRALIDALPPPLRGPLDELVVDGTLAGAAHIAFDLDDPASEGVTLALDVDPRTCRVVTDPPAADPARLTGAVEHTFPDGRRALVGPGHGDWVDLDDLPSHVRGAFVAAEDARFWDHGGFDLEQIARSLEVDLRERRFARGGSTISQQLVKNSFLDHRRTLTRKLQEAVLTWRLEAVLDKRAILGRYVNIIELGPDVFGVGAAARHWFGKPAEELDVHEAALLAALTPAPRTIGARLLRHRGLDPETAERVAVVLRAMRRAGVIDAATARAAAGEHFDFRAAAVGR